ncbi:MAG: hypothetical protein HYY21_10410 [Candidatus Tectomicrobia bacterium]|nr:hypothetical protein [Candidatus Tectomicrobia bacterium]
MSGEEKATRVKRRFPRFEVVFPLRVDDMDCEIQDISVMSFRFISKRKMPVGVTRNVTIRVVQKDGRETSVAAKAYIHWCKPIQTGGYMSGAEIWALSQKE